MNGLQWEKEWFNSDAWIHVRMLQFNRTVRNIDSQMWKFHFIFLTASVSSTALQQQATQSYNDEGKNINEAITTLFSASYYSTQNLFARELLIHNQQLSNQNCP